MTNAAAIGARMYSSTRLSQPPSRLDSEERRREQDGERLNEDVAPANVGELVRDRGFELLAPQCLHGACGHGERRARRAATDREQAWKPVGDEVEGRRSDAELGGDGVSRRAKGRVLGEREGARAEHSEKRAVAVAVDAGRRKERAEGEEERRCRAADQPTERAEHGREHGDEEPRFQEIERSGPALQRAMPRRRRPRSGRVEANPARARRSGSSNARTRRSATESGCGR